MNKPYLHLLLVLWVLAACSQSIEATPTSEVEPFQIVLPTLKPEALSEAVPAAMATGVLELDGRCIRLRAANNTSRLIIWDFGFKLEGRTIINTRSMQQISFGERVTLGGGMMPDGWELVPAFEVQLDKNCHGPYWMATNILD